MRKLYVCALVSVLALVGRILLATPIAAGNVDSDWQGQARYHDDGIENDRALNHYGIVLGDLLKFELTSVTGTTTGGTFYVYSSSISQPGAYMVCAAGSTPSSADTQDDASVFNVLASATSIGSMLVPAADGRTILPRWPGSLESVRAGGE